MTDILGFREKNHGFKAWIDLICGCTLFGFSRVLFDIHGFGNTWFDFFVCRCDLLYCLYPKISIGQTGVDDNGYSEYFIDSECACTYSDTVDYLYR